MATHKASDFKLIVGSGTGTVDLSSWVKSIDYPKSIETLDDTRMGHAVKANIAGLGDESLTVQFAQDFAASAVDATLAPQLGSAISVELRPTSGTASATNPKWSGTMLLAEYKPLGASIGEYHMTQAKWMPYGGTGLTRGTS